MSDKLTVKQEKYVQGLFAGLSQREAYKQAYNCSNWTDNAVDVEACSVSEVSIGKDGQFKFKLYCKDNALVKLGQTLGIFKDNINISGGTNNTTTDISDLPPEALEEIAKAQGQEEVMRIVGKYRK